MIDCFSRYPISRTEYNQKTGRLLAHRIVQLFTVLGYKTWICKGQNKGIDLSVSRDGKLVFVAEIVNWSPRSNLPAGRLNRIIRNLSAYGCNRLFIYTAMGNEKVVDCLKLHGIRTLKIGFQILPEFFYQHFEAQGKVLGRRIDSRSTTKHVKSLLREYALSTSLSTMIMTDEDQISIKG